MNASRWIINWACWLKYEIECKADAIWTERASDLGSPDSRGRNFFSSIDVGMSLIPLDWLLICLDYNSKL
jgi:hypothetical protein